MAKEILTVQNTRARIVIEVLEEENFTASVRLQAVRIIG